MFNAALLVIVGKTVIAISQVQLLVLPFRQERQSEFVLMQKIIYLLIAIIHQPFVRAIVNSAGLPAVNLLHSASTTQEHQQNAVVMILENIMLNYVQVFLMWQGDAAIHLQIR